MSRAQHRIVWLVGLTSVLAVVTAILLTQHAGAQTGLDVAVRDSAFEPDGATSLLVNVTGTAVPDVLEADAFAVTENGQSVGPVTVTPLLESEQAALTAALVVDTSGSMGGDPISQLRAAAAGLIDDLTGQDIAVGLIEFADEVTTLSDPTTDAGSILAAVDELEADGQTALYDGVVAGVQLLKATEGIGSLVVFADGDDNASGADLEAAIAAALDAEVPVTVVALESAEFDPAGIQSLAEQTGGQFVTASDASQFTAIFAEVAEDVASQYTVEYVGAYVDAPDLDLAVTVDAGDATGEATFTVANVREASATGIPAPPAAPTFDAGIMNEPVAFWGAIAIAFVGLALFLGILLVPRGDRATSRTLAAGLALSSRGGVDRPSTGLSATGLGKRAIALVALVPKPEGYEERLQSRLDRAGWQLRGSEFTAMQGGLAIAGMALGWAITGSLFFGVLGGVAGALGPVLALTNTMQRRQNAFMAQLPGTLQLLSGTLKAGYGTLQGIDTIVKETEAPMSTEFQRVLTEARLGLPLEESLEAMAERIGNDDFRWVVVAMNIQRQVGGNLAALLETVSETLRGREAVRRQIQVLSAEGRLSAIILVALPFVLVGYLSLINPEYLMQLFQSFVGLVMVGVASALMVLGIFWMRRLVKIDV